MQRRDSLGESNKIPRPSTGSTRRFRSRHSQSSISSSSDVFAFEATSEGHSNLSVSTDHRYQEDPQEPGDDLKREGVKKPQRTSERSEADAGEELLFKGTSRSGTKSNNR